MQFNVAQLLKEPTGSERSFELESALIDTDIQLDYVIGAGRMVRTHHGIWVQAALTTQISQDCSRCLVNLSRTLALDLEEEFFPEIDLRTGRRDSPPDDWEGLFIDPDNTLNLSEAIRQGVITELPLKPLCRPDCNGICDICGIDRNLSDCTCYESVIDPRWAALRTLNVES